MKYIATEKKGFMITVILLIVFGMVVTLSASISVKLHDGMDIAPKIILNTGLAIVAMVFVMIALPIQRWKTQGVIYPAIALLLVLLLVPLVFRIQINGAYRWIPLGFFNLQPAELAKILVVAFLAYVFSTMREDRPTIQELIPVGVVTGLMVLFIFLERDLGIPLVIAVTVLSMLYVTRTSRVLVAVIAIVGLLLFAVAIMMAPHRKGRVMAYFERRSAETPIDFEKIPENQLDAAVLAVSSAGFSGKGLGNSETKFSSLTEAHNDFVFSLIVEELGLIGFVIVAILFVMFMVFGVWMAYSAEERFEHYFLLGMVFMTMTQAVLHMMVNVDLLPAKGFGLPYISYGGSSMLSHMVMTGLAMTARLKGER